MLTIIDDAVFLSAEVKSFSGRDNATVNYVEVKFLDANNDVQKCTMNLQVHEQMVDANEIPERLDVVRIELEVTEEDGKKGKYLKKKVISIA